MNCPHCGSTLKRWRVPEEATWTEPTFLVCFDDACPFYVRGWVHMQEKYGQKGSFRYMVNPRTGASSSIPVWSDTATREQIEEDS